MPINWTRHDTLRIGHKLPPIDAQAKRCVEDVVSRALALAAPHSNQIWGEAIGYGLYSTAVVRVPAEMQQRYPSCFGDVAVKVFQSGAATMVEFQRLLARTTLPTGFQRTIDAGHAATPDGRTRGYVVLQYVEGSPLEELLRRPGGLEPTRAHALVAAFLRELLVPAWSKGLRFWDFRAGNLIAHPTQPGLVMIDTDALHPAVEEMNTNADVWTRRDQQERLAFKRLPGVIALILDQTESRGRKRASIALERSGLFTTLHELGRGTENTLPALDAIDHLLS